MESLTSDEKLARLWEEREVEKVMLRFGRALDTGDWAAYQSCFTDPVNINFERLTGRPEIRVSPELWTRFAQMVQTPVRRHHAYSNFTADLTADTAHALTYFSARVWRATDRGSTTYAEHGWYEAWFVLEAGGWKIVRLKHSFEWVEGNSALLDVHEPELQSLMTTLFSDAHVEAAQDYLKDAVLQ